SLSLEAFQSDRRFLSDDYEQRNTGGRIGLGRALWGPNRARLTYSLENIDVHDVADDASEVIQAEEGERLKSALTLAITHDTRNNFFVPSKGNRTILTLGVAGGPLAGDTDIYNAEVRVSHYIPVFVDHVLSFRGAVAIVESYGDSDSVPIFDREFLGGARTLRGFRFRDVGPKDENGEPIGGQSSWFGSFEYTVPLFQQFRAAAFYDIGMVNDDTSLEFGDYNSDVGIGVRLDFPGLPLRMDYAWPIEADEFNDKSGGRFNILLGHVF
ncbi:MAG: BamA/TamA family outer membrane protein, partial [Verrucomicrobiota bacterium]